MRPSLGGAATTLTGRVAHTVPEWRRCGGAAARAGVALSAEGRGDGARWERRRSGSPALKPLRRSLRDALLSAPRSRAALSAPRRSCCARVGKVSRCRAPVSPFRPFPALPEPPLRRCSPRCSRPGRRSARPLK